MRLEECRDDAEFLEDNFTPKQLMNKATGEFIKAHGKDGTKGEDLWDDEPETDKTRQNFKMFWKNRVHKITTTAKITGRRANSAMTEGVGGLKEALNTMRVDVSALQAENRSCQHENQALQARLQCEQQSRNSGGGTSSDDIGTLTDVTSKLSTIEQRLNAKIDKIASKMSTTGSDRTVTAVNSDSTNGPTTSDLLLGPQCEPVNHHSSLSGGKGLIFKKHCWKCGCATTHWTRNCPLLSKEQKDRHKNANFQNRMGGSDEWAEDRKGEHQSEFGFDSH